MSDMARLEQVLRGVKMVRARQSPAETSRLPITLTILSKLRAVWLSSHIDTFDGSMLWAASSVCFFGRES